MAQNIGIPLDEMEKIYNKFFGKFAKAKAWLENTVKRSRKKLFTFNPFGFRRNLFGYLSANKGLSGAMDRRAQNSPIQGFASQLGFIAARLLVVKLDAAFEDGGMLLHQIYLLGQRKDIRDLIQNGLIVVENVEEFLKLRHSKWVLI
jgi:DNA polymerase I-like protein with 3'-5' exonuclease and polymerase domains